MISLKELYLNNNQITFLYRQQFVHLRNLKKLDLGYNKLKQVGNGLFSLNPLKELFLTANEIESLPNDLITRILCTLELLDLDMNNLIPQSVYPLNISSQDLPGLHLSFGFNNVTKLPNYLFNATSWISLKSISLHHNHIASLPPGIFLSNYLLNLETIDLSNNLLKTLPLKLLHNPILTKLNLLVFSYNILEMLPFDLFSSKNLIHLRDIGLKKNKIKVLPDTLFHSPYLKELRVIDLGYNQLIIIPPFCFNNQALENLAEIYLNHNNIKSVIPDMLPKKLNNLKELNLAFNSISSLGELVLKVLANASIPCKLDVSYNNLCVQETSFTQTEKSDLKINGYLDLSHNKIDKFEEAQAAVFGTYVTVPFRKWLHAKGNHIFSIVNLV